MVAKPVAGLLLAASAGRRYGIPKALAEYEGELLVDRGLRILHASGCAPLVVVLGAGAQDVGLRAALTGATVVINRDWATGLGSSVRAGLSVVGTSGAQSVAILSVDSPGATVEAVRRLVERQSPAALVTASYHGASGYPMLIGRQHWSGVAFGAIGDTGAQPYLDAHAELLVEVACEEVADGTELDEASPV